MVLLLNYLVVDEVAAYYAKQRFRKWHNEGIKDVHDIIDELIEPGGGMVGKKLRPGVYVLGNLYDPKLKVSGDIWVSKILKLIIDENGGYLAKTASGTYRLLSPAEYSITDISGE